LILGRGDPAGVTEMKERYFTPGSIREKAMRMIGELPASCRGRSPYFDPARSALLVLDMQRYFLDEGSHAYVPSARTVVPGIRRLSEAFIGIGRPVITTRHLNTESDAGMMAVWWKDLIAEGQERSEIIDELAIEGAHVIVKSQYDAFHGGALEGILADSGTEQVVITGVLTHLCCETTARSGFVMGYSIFLAVDGTATYNEAFHRASLLNLSHGFAVPMLVGDLIGRIGGR